jgi:endonuclease/exonuclease/phosphatase family metal-dependent hydrolase
LDLKFSFRGDTFYNSSQKPDIVFLQEVVDETEFILNEKLGKLYNFTSGSFSESSNRRDPIGYFTMILSRKKSCDIKSKNLIWFNNSAMGRNLLQVKLNFRDNIKICAMTAHLESTTEFSKQRVEQLKRCFDEISEQDNECLVFFGGDLNLRDSEVIF